MVVSSLHFITAATKGEYIETFGDFEAADIARSKTESSTFLALIFGVVLGALLLGSGTLELCLLLLFVDFLLSDSDNRDSVLSDSVESDSEIADFI